MNEELEYLTHGHFYGRVGQTGLMSILHNDPISDEMGYVDESANHLYDELTNGGYVNDFAMFDWEER